MTVYLYWLDNNYVIKNLFFTIHNNKYLLCCS
nr:MAG TPA: hypothetical protein [Bacteriophage sp.]